MSTSRETPCIPTIFGSKHTIIKTQVKLQYIKHRLTWLETHNIITRKATYIRRNIEARWCNHCCSGEAIIIIQGVPLATEPGNSLTILTPMKISQRNFNRSTFVVWEMKRNVSVVSFCSAPNCCDTEQLSASQPGSVASGTHYIFWVCVSVALVTQ